MRQTSLLWKSRVKFFVCKYDNVIVTVKHTGNITFNDVLGIARIMRERSMAKNLAGTVKEVLGRWFTIDEPSASM